MSAAACGEACLHQRPHDIFLGNNVAQAVGAEQDHVAGLDIGFGDFGFQGRLDPDRPRDDVAEPGRPCAFFGDGPRPYLLGDIGMIVGDLTQNAVAQQVSPAVPGVSDIETVTFNDGGDTGGAHALAVTVFACQRVDTGVGPAQGSGQRIRDHDIPYLPVVQQLRQRVFGGFHGGSRRLLPERPPPPCRRR